MSHLSTNGIITIPDGADIVSRAAYDAVLEQIDAALASRGAGTLIVAAANSLRGAGADYVCDGTDDEVQINAAIDALSAGGKIVLLDGTFRLGAPIVMAPTVHLKGQGSSTWIMLEDDHDADIALIEAHADPAANWMARISDLSIHGNKSEQSSGTITAVSILEASHVTIDHLNVMYCDNGVVLDLTGFCKVRDCYFYDVMANVIAIQNGGDCHQILDNIINRGSAAPLTPPENIGVLITAVSTDAACQGVIVRGNHIFNVRVGVEILDASQTDPYVRQATVEGNHLMFCTDTGIFVSGERGIIKSNHVLCAGTYGIRVTPGYDNIIAENVVEGAGMDPYADSCGISVQAMNTNVQGNIIRRKRVGEGDNNPTQTKTGLYVTAGATDNWVHGNDLRDSGYTANYDDDGTGTLQSENLGIT